MGIVRNVVLCLFFVAAVYVASANVQPVEIVYLPAFGGDSPWNARSVEIPLFVVILGALVVGALIGGITGLLEQGRLRLALRRAVRAEHKAREQLAETESSLGKEQASSHALRAELSAVRAATSAPPSESASASEST